MPIMKRTSLKPILILAGLGCVTMATIAVADNQAQAPQSAYDAADTDLDGTLNRREFIAYSEGKASEGDPDYTALVDTADYDLAFAERDLNADGRLDRGELGEVIDDSVDAPDMSDLDVDDSGSGMDSADGLEGGGDDTDALSTPKPDDQ